MPKQILSGSNLRQKLLSGAKQLSDPVTTTLGPKGRNVGIENTWTDPQVVHDGVSVAKAIELPDPFENFSAQLILQASRKSADKAGDGTTTATLLAYEMIKSGFEKIEEGANPMTIKEGMEKALEQALTEINKQSRPVTTKEEIQQVAVISSASKEMGNIIGEAVHRVGKDGVVNTTIYEGMGLEVEYKEGMEFDKGFISPQFINNDKEEVELEAPHILITDMVITSPDEIAKFLSMFVKATNRQEIAIICSDMVGGALSTLVVNKERSNINPVAIFAPAIGDRRKQILEDIATVTGGKVLYKDGTIKLDEIDLSYLGRADRIIIDKDKTKIVGGFGTPEDIEKRAVQIREEIKKTEGDFEKEKLQERLARLTSGAAIIKVGATTEVELSDKKERVIDAVEATKAAVAEGIVAGGGMTLLRTCEKFVSTIQDDNDLGAGEYIVYEALEKPFEKLLENSGITLAEGWKTTEGKGINVMTGEEVNLLEAGIIDPTRVVKEALKNAVSVASMLLTTEAVICKIPETKESS